MSDDGSLRSCVRAALAALDVRRLVFAIHDASFPGAADEDTGRGAPASREAERLLRAVSALGFDGVQLGPQGENEDGAASPYESAVFARNTLSIPVARLADDAPWAALLDPARLAAILGDARRAGAAGTERAALAVAERARDAALDAAYAAFHERRRDPGDEPVAALAKRLDAFVRANADWLEREGAYRALGAEHGTPDWRRWNEPDALLYDPAPQRAEASRRRLDALRRRHAARIGRMRFAQLLAHEAHEQLRATAGALDLALHGDLQIGVSLRDHWAWRGLFLSDYAMGAPPSRTNPEGQPWHYPVLDPAQVGDGDAPGAALRFVARRLDKAFAEFDALRIDHPHGWVCPWVYDAAADDRFRAVRAGARLFASPHLPDHPALTRYAIAREADLNPDPATPRFADDWVVRLSDAQVEGYARLFDAVVAAARRAGRSEGAVVCEVLSTLPYPLARVLDRHGLGRFRVTQKADLANPRDVYRSENAAAADWVMLGNHDTPPIWRCLETWRERGETERRAAYLAERLAPVADERPALRAALARDPGRLAQALLADLLASPARHVMVSFSDLFGLRELYNAPGTVGPDNWTLRLPAGWERAWRERLAADRALDLPLACALALRARGGAGKRHGALIERLEAHSRALRAGPAGAAPGGARAAAPGGGPTRRPSSPETRRQPAIGIDIDRDAWATRAFLALADALARYHRHRVVHLEHLARVFDTGRRAVLVGNHALDIVDPLLLLAHVYRELGRAPHFVGHEAWARLPLLRDVARRFQVIPARRPAETLDALRRSGFLMLFPGGNREAAMRSYRDAPYRLDWEGRQGYLRLALEGDAELVFAAAIGNDDAYYQSRLPTPELLLRWVNRGDASRYRGARLAFGMLGPHLVPGLVPLPVRLTHVLSEPIDLGDRERALREPAAFDALHERVWAECQRFLDAQLAARERHSDRLDRWVRAGERRLRSLGF